MSRCTFCGNEVPQGRGSMLVMNDGTIKNYCNSKCERNADLKRDPRFVKWTATYHNMKEASKASRKG